MDWVCPDLQGRGGGPKGAPSSLHPSLPSHCASASGSRVGDQWHHDGHKTPSPKRVSGGVCIAAMPGYGVTRWVPSRLGQCHLAGMGTQRRRPTAAPRPHSSSPAQHRPFDHAPLGGERRQLRKIFVKSNTMPVEYFFSEEGPGLEVKKKKKKAANLE